jgi:hypothetical protein
MTPSFTGRKLEFREDIEVLKVTWLIAKHLASECWGSPLSPGEGAIRQSWLFWHCPCHSCSRQPWGWVTKQIPTALRGRNAPWAWLSEVSMKHFEKKISNQVLRSLSPHLSQRQGGDFKLPNKLARFNVRMHGGEGWGERKISVIASFFQIAYYFVHYEIMKHYLIPLWSKWDWVSSTSAFTRWHQVRKCLSHWHF